MKCRAAHLRSDSQEVLLRGHNRHLTGEEIAKLPLITHPDGAVLAIGDVGTVRDAFTDLTAISEFDGRPVLVLSVHRSTSEDLLGMVDSVKEFAQTPFRAGWLPPDDLGRSFRGSSGTHRFAHENGLQGLAIVFVLLAVFLDLRLHFGLHWAFRFRC